MKVGAGGVPWARRRSRWAPSSRALDAIARSLAPGQRAHVRELGSIRVCLAARGRDDEYATRTNRLAAMDLLRESEVAAVGGPLRLRTVANDEPCPSAVGGRHEDAGVTVPVEHE